jgi:hypothetical protein
VITVLAGGFVFVGMPVLFLVGYAAGFGRVSGEVVAAAFVAPSVLAVLILLVSGGTWLVLDRVEAGDAR